MTLAVRSSRRGFLALERVAEAPAGGAWASSSLLLLDWAGRWVLLLGCPTAAAGAPSVAAGCLSLRPNLFQAGTLCDVALWAEVMLPGPDWTDDEAPK